MSREIMRVGALMRQPVVVVTPDDILVDAAARMVSAAIDVAPVCVDGRLVGLLVGRDIVARARAAGCDPTTTTVRDLMTSDPIHGQAEHDLGAADRLMRQRKIGQLAIVDDDKRLVGVVFRHDLADNKGHVEPQPPQPVASSIAEPRPA